MTVRELIDKLSLVDPESEVFIPGYEGGYNDIHSLEPIMVCKDFYTEWYYGKHEEYDIVRKGPGNPHAYTLSHGILLTRLEDD